MSNACVVGKITLDSSVRINGAGEKRGEERRGREKREHSDHTCLKRRNETKELSLTFLILFST